MREVLSSSELRLAHTHLSTIIDPHTNLHESSHATATATATATSKPYPSVPSIRPPTQRTAQIASPFIAATLQNAPIPFISAMKLSYSSFTLGALLTPWWMKSSCQ